MQRTWGIGCYKLRKERFKKFDYSSFADLFMRRQIYAYRTLFHDLWGIFRGTIIPPVESSDEEESPRRAERQPRVDREEPENDDQNPPPPQPPARE